MKLDFFDEEDYESLESFMRPIWHDTYSFLPKAQVEFLLKKYFSSAGISHFKNLGYKYLKITDTDKVGVVVYCERDGVTYLDKLYLLPDSRGHGYPEFVFCELLKLGRDIVLNVNRSNERAVACYKKNGFVIEKEEAIDLSGGMINRDYVMRLCKKNFYIMNSKAN